MRVNDEQVLGLTGAQWMCLALIPFGVWVLFWLRPRLAAEENAVETASTEAAADEVDASHSADSG